MLPRTEKLMTEIESWCAEKRGRQSELARSLGVSRQELNVWIKRKQKPPSEVTLALIEFLQDPEAFQKGRGLR
jgi:predicted XRE-type DNA-binding protein